MSLVVMQQVGIEPERAAGHVHGLVAPAEGIAGPGLEGEDKRTVGGIGSVGERVVERLKGLLQVLLPRMDVAPRGHGQSDECLAGEQRAVSLDGVEVEELRAGGRVFARYGLDAIVGHLAHGAHGTLHGHHVIVGVEYSRNVEHVAAAGIVVEIVVGENLHHLAPVADVDGKLLVGAVDPRRHGSRGFEISLLVHVGVHDVVGVDEAARAQCGERRCRAQDDILVVHDGL
jgi:hypothetical protein